MYFNKTNFKPREFSINGVEYKYVDITLLCKETLHKFPFVLRLLLENAVRYLEGNEREEVINALFEWTNSGTSNTEIPFQPGRVLMHDTTSTPALVDMAGMRDAIAEMGGNPSVLNPVLPVDISVDHSLAVEVFAKSNAAKQNLEIEMRRNRERYRFLRWASKSFQNIRINPPGTGIMHTINLEQLATIVTTEMREGLLWAVPDTMLGTDSHTPMINGIGVLGWGIGGLEAESVMFGMPTMIRIPEIVGVKLIGELKGNAQATDLALTVTRQLRSINVTGEFVEFYGPGITSLTAGDRSVVANMAPEYGATTGFFPVDEQTLKYLRDTGRSDSAIALVEEYTKRNGLWFDPLAQPCYTRSIEIDLSKIGIQVAGPQRPQDLLDYSKVTEVLSKLKYTPNKPSSLPRHAVALASITSCTNTTDPRLLITAGLLARNARKHGLRVPEWVKTSLAPGSPAAATYLKRAGLIEDLSSVGFDIVGYGCTTCIGNPGPLPDSIIKAQKDGNVKAVAILSGNRNFPGRIHPDLELGFIMSPALVIAFALAGDAERNLKMEPIQATPDGHLIYLKDLWPSRHEVDTFVLKAINSIDYKQDFMVASQNIFWETIDTPDTVLFPWEEQSTILKRPPFTYIAKGNLLGKYSAFPLLVLGDDVTTDHISPASAIPQDSYIAEFLAKQGEDVKDLNVFASRRGNWEVMIRAAFYNKSLKNLLAPESPVAHTMHIPSGEILPIWITAQRYQDDGDSVILIAGKRYGMGSSRDWAAKGLKLLGIRAVLASGFERIHRSNLIGMGILPLILPRDIQSDSILDCPHDRIEILAEAQTLSPYCSIPVQIMRTTGLPVSIKTTAAIETQFEVELLKRGGVIPSILHQLQ